MTKKADSRTDIRSRLEKAQELLRTQRNYEKIMSRLVTNYKVHFAKDPLPCYIRATKRCIRLMMQASGAVCGEKQRDGFVRARFKSRAIMKHFNTKFEFRFAQTFATPNTYLKHL